MWASHSYSVSFSFLQALVVNVSQSKGVFMEGVGAIGLCFRLCTSAYGHSASLGVGMSVV